MGLYLFSIYHFPEFLFHTYSRFARTFHVLNFAVSLWAPSLTFLPSHYFISSHYLFL